MTTQLGLFGDDYQQATRALSIRHAWAWAIMNAGKDVENRSWSTTYRGRFWVQVSKSSRWDSSLWPLEEQPPADVPRGVIIGSVELVDVVTNSSSRWALPGEFHWVLADPQPLATPVPCVGALQLFTPSAAVQQLLA